MKKKKKENKKEEEEEINRYLHHPLLYLASSCLESKQNQ